MATLWSGAEWHRLAGTAKSFAFAMVPQGKTIWPLRSRLYASTSGLALLSPSFDNILREERAIQAWETKEVYPGARQVLHHFMPGVQLLFAKRDVPRAQGLICEQGPFSPLVLSVLSTLLLLTDKSRLPPAEGSVSSYCDDSHCLIMGRALGQGGIALQTVRCSRN